MTTIDKIIGTILQHEGGYINHPADRGGPTKYGITLKTLQDYRGTPTTAQDVKNMGLAEAKEIYRMRYYRAPRIDRLTPCIQALVFDMAVNHGPKRAIKILQMTLRDDFDKPVGKIDGKIGPKTTQATARATENGCNALINALVDRRIDYYYQIIHNDPSQRVFENGWISRAESFREMHA